MTHGVTPGETRELAGAVGEGATPCTDGRPPENTPAWIASQQFSLRNAAKGYPPRSRTSRDHEGSRASAHPLAMPTSCWAAGQAACADGEHCFVKYKGGKGGHALCLTSCPAGWLCETRGSSGRCGSAPLNASRLTPAPFSASSALFARVGAPGVRLCDRALPPPAQSTYQINCYNGGFTGNRYMMARNMLLHAACCSAVALLPPSFDAFPDAGASCFDFRSLASSAGGAVAGVCSGVATDSAQWWSHLPKSTPLAAAGSLDVRL